MRILFTTFYDPAYLGIRMLASVAKEAGHEVGICQLKDFRHRQLSPLDSESHTGYFLYSKRNFSSSGFSEFPITKQELLLFEQLISEWKPDILGFTLRSPYNLLMNTLLPVMRRAAPQAFLVGGGFGPTYEPHIPLSLGADAVIRGEGEEALLELAACLSSGKDWRNIRNIAYLRNGQIVCNSLRPLLMNLDTLPFALYYGDHFFAIEDDTISRKDMRLVESYELYRKAYTILAGRGCIGNCSYCAGGNWRTQYRKQGLSAPRIRQRTLDNVMQELIIAKNHNEKFIIFADEYFVYPISDLIEFFKKYSSNIKLPFFGHFHHHQLLNSQDFLEIIKYAGLSSVAVGVQSASEDFASRVYYRKNKNKEILKYISLCQDNGFSGNYQIIGGNTMETQDDIERLFDFCSHIRFDASLKTDWYLHSAILRPLAGSPIVDQYPELLTQAPYPAPKFAEIMLLAEIRNKVDDQTFASIRKDPFFSNHPERLHALLYSLIRDLHLQYLVKEIQRLYGKEVYFWGCGEMYKYKRHLFSKLKPRCILVDKGQIPDTIDGLRVCHPDDVLLQEDILPIVIFSRSVNTICRTIARQYPKYTDIVSCAVF